MQSYRTSVEIIDDGMPVRLDRGDRVSVRSPWGTPRIGVFRYADDRRAGVTIGALTHTVFLDQISVSPPF